MATQVTHLKLSEPERRLASMRAAMLGSTLSEYIGQLILTDAHLCGLDALLDKASEKEVHHGDS